MNRNDYARFYTDVTGVDCILWVTSKQGNLNEPFIAIQIDDDNPESDSIPNMAISILDNPRIIASNDGAKVDKCIMQQVVDWINLNRELLLRHWRNKVSTGQLSDELKPILEVDIDASDYFYIGGYKVNHWYLCNFRSIHTGVDTIIYASPKQPTLTEPLIFVKVVDSNDRKFHWPNIAISISEHPKIVATNTAITIDDSLWQQLTQWIALNRELLLDYWHNEDTGELIKKLKKIS